MSLHRMKKISKIVLIIPPSPWLLDDRELPFDGILYVAAYLKKFSDCEVVVCDLTSLPEENWYIPIGDLYGVTGVTPNFIYIRDIIKKLKNREPNKSVIVGGVHASVFPKNILEKTLADACVVGEGERTALQIVNGVDWRNIPGLMTREYDNGPPVLIKNLDALPLPDRKAIDVYSYISSSIFNYLAPDVERVGSLCLSRGCYYNCSFCCSKKIHSGKVRLRSAESCVDELAYLKSEFGIGMVNVFDDTFMLNKQRIYEICQLLIERKVEMKWYCLTRVDDVNLDILLLMKKAGCVSVSAGFETGSNRILKLMNKKTTVEKANVYVKMVAKADLKINGQMIVGFPTETDEDIELTAKFIRENPEIAMQLQAKTFEALGLTDDKSESEDAQEEAPVTDE